MPIQTKNPGGVKQLLEDDPEYVFVDVRTVEEFEQGHVPGAYNVPIAFRTMTGMQPNPEFLAVMKRLFAKEQKIVFG
jgi:rhodanese-related sulfurtransferase